MRNRLFQTKGIVLKSIKLNESDKIITLFSQDYGKIKAIAKGIRKTKSRFGSSLENLTLVKILAYKGNTLNIINQTEIMNTFFFHCKDLTRYGLATFCAEMVDKVSVEEDPNEMIYELLKKVLTLLKNEENPILLVESFKWKLFHALGYQPILNRCVQCGKKMDELQKYIFDIKMGGMVCLECREKNSLYQIQISSYFLRLLRRIISANLESIHNKQVIESALKELVLITDKYMSYHFEIRNRSKQFLQKLESL